MNHHFVAAMRRAMLSTRASNVTEATRVIQEALAEISRSAIQKDEGPEILAPPLREAATPFRVDPHADIVEPQDASRTASSRPETPATSHRMRKPLGETLRILREGQLWGR